MLSTAKLGDVVVFSAGRNQSRSSAFSGVSNGVDNTYYTQSDFEADSSFSDCEFGGNDKSTSRIVRAGELKNEKGSKKENKKGDLVVRAGDVVVSTFTYDACTVSKADEGKVLSQNFLRLDFTQHNELLPEFFLYLFNEDRQVQRQKKSAMQGEAVKRLPLTALAEIRVPLPSQELQEKIGNAYMSAKRLSYATTRQARLVEDFAMSFLNMSVGGLQ